MGFEVDLYSGYRIGRVGSNFQTGREGSAASRGSGTVEIRRSINRLLQPPDPATFSVTCNFDDDVIMTKRASGSYVADTGA